MNGKIYYPGQYTPEQQADLDAARAKLIQSTDTEEVKIQKTIESSFMPGGPRIKRVVTEDMIRQHASDKFASRLFTDPEYAKTTKCGTMIAPPEMFAEASFPMWRHETFGTMVTGNDGGLLECYKPIKVGDVITEYNDFEQILDTTDSNGGPSREFTFVGGIKAFNQDGELVAYGEGYGRNATSLGEQPDGPAAAMATWGMHVEDVPQYTDEDWEKIYAMWDQETVRGADTLYWEDVEIGYKPPLVSSHPLTLVDAVYMSGEMAIRMAPMAKKILRENKDNPDQVYTSADGIKHMRRVEQSINTMGEFSRLFVMMAYGRRLMLNMITSFIGDEGWLRRLNWRNGPKANPIIRRVPGFENAVCDTHTCIGDVIIAKAVAVRKYKDDEGCKVDFICWTETLRGGKCTAAEATVILPSKAQ